jgi:hypothetical protein
MVGPFKRTEIVADYAGLRPEKITSLREWLVSTHKDAGYESISTPCFKPSDPQVYLYGKRPRIGPIIVSVFWDQETEEWVYAGMLERTESRKRIEELGHIVESIKCGEVRFN